MNEGISDYDDSSFQCRVYCPQCGVWCINSPTLGLLCSNKHNFHPTDVISIQFKRGDYIPESIDVKSFTLRIQKHTEHVNAIKVKIAELRVKSAALTQERDAIDFKINNDTAYLHGLLERNF